MVGGEHGAGSKHEELYFQVMLIPFASFFFVISPFIVPFFVHLPFFFFLYSKYLPTNTVHSLFIVWYRESIF